MRRKSNEPYEFAALADYNAEVARGLVHTPEWQAKMAAEQQRFNAQVWPTPFVTRLPDPRVRLAAALEADAESLHQSHHPQTSGAPCRYCEKEEM